MTLRATRLPIKRLPAQHLKSLPARPQRRSPAGPAPIITRASRARFAQTLPEVNSITVSSIILEQVTSRLAGSDDTMEVQIELRRDFRPIGLISYEVIDGGRTLVSGGGDAWAGLERSFSAAGSTNSCYLLNVYREDSVNHKTLLGRYEIHVGSRGLQDVWIIKEQV